MFTFIKLLSVIVAVASLSGCGYFEAKDAVEKFESKLNFVLAQQRLWGCLNGAFRGLELVDNCAWVFDGQPVFTDDAKFICAVIPVGFSRPVDFKCTARFEPSTLKSLAVQKLLPLGALPHGFSFDTWLADSEPQ